MKKNMFFTTIVIFVVGLVYGAIFNSILRGENALVFYCCVQGTYVGIFSSLSYFMLALFLGYCFDDNNALGKTCIIIEDIIAIACVMYSITIFVNSNNKYPITLPHAWMHIVNLLFAVVVVVKANYDGKILRKK